MPVHSPREAELGLAGDELLLLDDPASHRTAVGHLYLTSVRLIWVSERVNRLLDPLNIIGGPKRVDIPKNEILECKLNASRLFGDELVLRLRRYQWLYFMVGARGYLWFTESLMFPLGWLLSKFLGGGENRSRQWYSALKEWLGEEPLD